MQDWLNGKQRKHRAAPFRRQGHRRWGLSLLLICLILIISLTALVAMPKRSVLPPSATTIQPGPLVPLSGAIAPLTGDQSARPSRGYPVNQRAADAERVSGAPIISAHEPTHAFTGAVDNLAPDIRRIVERGVLRVALPANDAFPFFYRASQNLAAEDASTPLAASRAPEPGDGLEGIDVQIGRSLAAYLGVEVVFDRSSPTFDAVVEQVFERNVDLAIAKMSLTLDRARKVRYSQPYVNLRPGLLFNRLALSDLITVDRHRHPVAVVRQLGRDARLGVIRASAYASFARSAFPDATIIEYANWESLVNAIIHGRVLAGCRDELAIKHEILMRTNANLQMQSVVIDEWMDEIAVALPWDSTVLGEFVDHYLSKTHLSFTADQLLTRFIHTQAEPPTSL